MKPLGLALGLALTASGATAQPSAAPWNPAAPENRVVLPTFNYATVEPVLAAIGARSVRRGTPDRPALDITFPNNRRAAILFGNCEGQGAVCKAISIQSLWNAPRGAAAARLPAAILSFNQRYAFSRAYLLADGRPALQRYLTADFGFIRGNLAINLLVFANQIERFSAEVLH